MRPYGCTFTGCSETFKKIEDWKRHENSQHIHLEMWRCDHELPEVDECAKVYYRQQTFREHLNGKHQLDNDAIKVKAELCRIGRNNQGRFWCGFCIKLIDLRAKGADAWGERFSHIDDHFMGRHDLAQQGIQDWFPVNRAKPKNIEMQGNGLEMIRVAIGNLRLGELWEWFFYRSSRMSRLGK